MQEVTLTITGMTCAHCVRAVTHALTHVAGVDSVTVSLVPPAAKVTGDADNQALIAAVVAEGYTATVV